MKFQQFYKNILLKIHTPFPLKTKKNTKQKVFESMCVCVCVYFYLGEGSKLVKERKKAAQVEFVQLTESKRFSSAIYTRRIERIFRWGFSTKTVSSSGGSCMKEREAKVKLPGEIFIALKLTWSGGGK